MAETLIGVTCENLVDQIHDLRTDISNREKKIYPAEAKTFLDDVNQLYNQIFELSLSTWTVDTVLTYPGTELEFIKAQKKYRGLRPMVTNLRIELEKIISDSDHSPTSSAETNLSSQTSQPRTEPVSDPQSKILIQTQKFLIKQMESVVINDDVCAAKAQVLYDHVEKLYDRFISNQVQIDIQVEGEALVDQQTIASQTHQKVIDIQTRLKKIIVLNEKTPKATNSSNQPHQADDSSKLDSLTKKSNFLRTQINSLETKGCVSAAKAKVTYDHLASIYEKFVSNQMEIEERVDDCGNLNFHRDISKQVQRDVIQMQTYLKTIFDPTLTAQSQSFAFKQAISGAPPQCAPLAQTNSGAPPQWATIPGTPPAAQTNSSRFENYARIEDMINVYKL